VNKLNNNYPNFVNFWTSFPCSLLLELHINTIIKTTSVCDGDARSVSDGHGRPVGDTGRLPGWPVTVGVVEMGVVDTRYGVSQTGADAECYARLHCTHGLAGRGDGYQSGLDWGHSSFK